MTRVRVRGIYTTALTRLLTDADFDVVQASPSIRRRFEATFRTAEYDATIETTSDRQGVGVIGNPEAVDELVDRLATVGVDTFSWADPAPRGAVYIATVTDTLGRGAAVELGEGREGFLPYENVDGSVDDGDTLRVQIHDPAPPWTDRIPIVDTRIRVFGGVASLRRGSEETTVAANGAEARELAGLGDLLSADAPDGWGVRWERGATKADLDAMDDALSNGIEHAETIDATLADAPASDESLPGGDESDRLVAPEATTWVWFGRECRFALDDLRRSVAPTMAGHHRIKAARNSASTAVDFVEGVCESVEEFPQQAVLQQFGPQEDGTVAIEHGKPDGRLVTLGRGTVTEFDPEAGTLTVQRKLSGGGVYDGLGVPKESGDVATTTFTEGRWWYPTTYRDAEDVRKGTYVNVCTPLELFPNAVRYVDLHVDVLAHVDGSVERVDDDELDDAIDAGYISEPLAEKARVVAHSVERALDT